MQPYSRYSEQLEYLANSVARSPELSSIDSERIAQVLDGEPMRALRATIPLSLQRQSGAFFTSKELAELAVAPLRSSICDASTIVDVTCGAGDLLLACVSDQKAMNASHLLKTWGDQLVGCDQHIEFVSVAKTRIFLAALQQSSRIDLPDEHCPSQFLPNLQARDGFTAPELIRKATHIVLNPPFTRMQIPKEYNWANGKVNIAAVFVDFCISNANPGTRIVAILPDVLRSGSLYKAWRERIKARTTEVRVELYGQFDRFTDVHVFVLDLVVQQESSAEWIDRWGQRGIPGNQTIGDWFDVKVGSVVDYRDPYVGDAHPFFIPACLPPWGTVSNSTITRRYNGRLFNPPLVTIRRTSREEDTHRAVGTIIVCDQPVAIENHLIVLLPRDGKIETCERLLDLLQKPETSQWLNHRIRCRHLTVSSVKEIPWWNQGND